VVVLRHISSSDAFGGKNFGEIMLLFGVMFDRSRAARLLREP